MEDLCRACFEGNLEEATRLIDQGVSIQIEGDLYSSPLGWAMRGRDANIVRLLFEQGLVLEGEKAGHALHWASLKNMLDIMVVLLENVPIDQTDECGETALMAAVRSRHIDMIHLLLDRGASLHAVNPFDHFTPLHYARDEQVYQLLVDLGADEDAPSLPLDLDDPNWNGRILTPRDMMEEV